ncbi:transcriptional regulator [Listeria monocytogenes]|uniref:transcriptional regulator n=1 Tax=Listeria monocytogenes TaxID=1639 RepID=UPI00035923B7|nr:transcriptional regulator [Listeria monocytogenes]EAF3071383.1 transcriptional regulator [Listeria monocytogenes serotype 1/2a]AGR09987.1 hypothetical protein M639_12130 [Listeria monocytogenes]EAA0044939.1 transcriptional regulator [Listeria monocytogenes]EAA0080164.1 transcriptional regulator [Listeria monocytogenes]EAC4236557.1 transcriptional regulator [Listeria monocytogenes]
MEEKEKMEKENNFFVNEIRKQAFSRSLKRYRKEWNLTRREIIRNLNIKSYRDITQDFDEEVPWDERERKLNRWENGESFPTFEKIGDMIKESPKFAKVFSEQHKHTLRNGQLTRQSRFKSNKVQQAIKWSKVTHCVQFQYELT